MKRRISEFQPNTDARRAAEVLSGMKGLGVVERWYFDDLDNYFYLMLTREPGETRATARDVICMGKGALAILAHAQDMLQLGGTDDDPGQ